MENQEELAQFAQIKYQQAIMVIDNLGNELSSGVIIPDNPKAWAAGLWEECRKKSPLVVSLWQTDWHSLVLLGIGKKNPTDHEDTFGFYADRTSLENLKKLIEKALQMLKDQE